jgi:ABC-2 type transport system ATP-binding protein
VSVLDGNLQHIDLMRDAANFSVRTAGHSVGAVYADPTIAIV